MSNPNLHRIFNALADIQRLTWKLDDLGGAFHRTGNTKVSDELSQMSNDLVQAHDEIRSAYGEEVNQRMLDSEQSTRNMLAAAIMVATKVPGT